MIDNANLLLALSCVLFAVYLYRLGQRDLLVAMLAWDRRDDSLPSQEPSADDDKSEDS